MRAGVVALVVLAVVAALLRPHVVCRLRCADGVGAGPGARPTLVLCTHDYEHVDLLAMRREARRWRAATDVSTAFVVADRAHNHAFCRLLHRSACIPVRRHTTDKVRRALRTHHVVLFVYRNTVGTGAYYMARGAARVLLARVRVAGVPGPLTLDHGDAVPAILRKTAGGRVTVEYAPLPGPVGDDPRAFLHTLKLGLYGP